MSKCTFSKKLAIVFLCCFYGLCIAETPPTEFDRAVSWLNIRAGDMIRSSVLNMSSGVHAFPPQVGSGYEAFWLRDYEYMLEGRIETFTDRELKEACLLFVNAQRADGAMVDCIKFDGTPIYKPGYGKMGENPVADGASFAVGVAWHTFQKTKDRQVIKQSIDKLIRGLNAVPRDSNELVYIDPNKVWDRCSYGFTDSVQKKGSELFCSLLDVQASRQIADLLDVVDRKNEAKSWRQHGLFVTRSIRRVFWKEDIGLFRAATDHCTQPDLWGSAFAVYLRVADSKQSLKIAKYFKDNYGSIIKRGQLRHLPGGIYWDPPAPPPETYQNGAYWGTPIGWFAYTLDMVDSNLAEKTVINLVNDFKEKGVYECVNDNGYASVSNYIDSVALPLAGIRAMRHRRQDPNVTLSPSTNN